MGKGAKAPAYVLGVGLTKFIKPRGKVDYPELGFEAGIKALLDAQINYDDVEAGIACYCFGDSTCGQRTFYQFGMTQIPIYNVNNNCATGSTGLHMARDLVSHGAMDCVMVVGFEKMSPGPLRGVYKDRASPIGPTMEVMAMTEGVTGAPPPAQLFGNAGKEYMEKYGAKAEDFAEIARINHEHSSRNPYSQFREVYTLDQILQAPEIHPPLTKLQCCPTSDGGAAAIIVSEAFLSARHPSLKAQAVLIAGQHLATDSPDLYDGSAIGLIGDRMTRTAAEVAMAEAGVRPADIDVCELHDCFSANEMITLDALGLCEKGKAHEIVRQGLITYDIGLKTAITSQKKQNDDKKSPNNRTGRDGNMQRRVVTNPSGGLLSKGHPLGATGLAQCAELVWQLRGWATNRLVPQTRWALQHNLGLGGAAVVTVYRRADEADNTYAVPLPGGDGKTDSGKGLGYNAAIEARGFTAEQVNQVRSRKFRSSRALGDTESKVSARF